MKSWKNESLYFCLSLKVLKDATSNFYIIVWILKKLTRVEIFCFCALNFKKSTTLFHSFEYKKVANFWLVFLLLTMKRFELRFFWSLVLLKRWKLRFFLGSEIMKKIASRDFFFRRLKLGEDSNCDWFFVRVLYYEKDASSDFFFRA